MDKVIIFSCLVALLIISRKLRQSKSVAGPTFVLLLLIVLLVVWVNISP